MQTTYLWWHVTLQEICISCVGNQTTTLLLYHIFIYRPFNIVAKMIIDLLRA